LGRKTSGVVDHAFALTLTLDLQQRFVDLRFGRFVHFNMATFQDREWGDPTAAPETFHPTALDTDQWAAAARLANMTWDA
jgi:alpha-L-fucosidase